MTEHTFTIGQEWAYQTRPQEPDSTFIIVRIDEGGANGRIIHIYLKNLKMKNKLSPSGFNNHIVHLPCSEFAILNSGITLKHENVPLPDFKEGYNAWLKAFEVKKSFVFQVPLAESIDRIESMFMQ